MKDASSFLDVLLAAKKLQATELFGPWDMDANGHIAIEHLRPLLRSVFPSSSSLSQHGCASAVDHLSVSQVKRAYESVTRRPWALPPSLLTAPASAKQSRRCLDPMYLGPTLNEVHAIIDVLCGGETQPEVALRLDSRDPEEDASTWLAEARQRPSSNTAPLTPTTDTIGRRTAAMRAVHHPSLTNHARVAFLYGSMEEIYRTFCLAASSPGEPVPDTLPIDAAHLGRVAWNVHAQRLKLWEGRALHQLLAATATTAEADAHLTLEAFVELLCTT
ncbi:hypothetical protein LMJF_22_0370 [Leishmania major strain Friedlin]|uniref:EF-hand domain-containing protein n=1 Tax=Leishmania major TaxID=5664 RepID=Q4QBV8_LEIMA|nr:hypothetical protein LMJF_22_0370 [Leishmania major strain Friedlin]CAG9573905.1 hypothetical_protein_-_conserved [Leishmania major strain Friedlin]CAJ04033.1 hypothetical protein LMJF_22_0370 [Leishmania major strain Friedlin]|eukprot:XP_001683190.1 hypothetical protein LMJF_22_0370 [Leishmania major strain Friedlin]